MNEMKRRTRGFPKRLIAALMCVTVIFTAIPLSAAASDLEESSAYESETDAPVYEVSEESEVSEVSEPDEPSEEISEESEVSEESEDSEISSEASEESEESSEESESVFDADKLFEKLMACATADEMKSVLEGLTDEENDLMDLFTDEQNAALEEKMSELGFYDAVVTDSSYTIEQGDSKTVSKNSYTWIDSYTCLPGANGITVTGNNYGYTINVGSDVAVGTYTMTVSNYYSRYGSYKYTDNITLTVTAPQPQSAQIFYLKTPTSDPDSNDTKEWCDSSIGTGTVQTSGATWTDNKNIFNPGQYVVSLTSSMVKQSDGSYTLPKESYLRHWQSIYNAYKTQLEEELGVTLSFDDIEEIYLVPYKISKNNGTNPDKHIDCKISIKTSSVYAAVFWVTLPDGTQKQVDAANYKTGTAVKETSNAPTGSSGNYPETMTVDGVTYKFDGWYNEEGDKVASWDYTPTEAELSDGTVNFYAHYVPYGYTLTVKKVIKGDYVTDDELQNEKFPFTVSYGTTTESFELGNGDTKTFTVPAGTKVSIRETDKKDYYFSVELSENDDGIWDYNYDIHDGKDDGLTITMPKKDLTVTVTNSKYAIIDMGVTLESLPYILIIAVVAVGAVLIVIKRRRREDR